jgi:hypothetical protein
MCPNTNLTNLTDHSSSQSFSESDVLDSQSPQKKYESEMPVKKNKIKKARFKQDPNKLLKESKCILMGISMNQSHQTGAEFSAFVDLIKTLTKIEKVIILVTDDLHRHRLGLRALLNFKWVSMQN